MAGSTQRVPGQRLTDDEVAELNAYRERGVAPPARFDGVVLDNATGGGMHYRWRTAEEEKAAADRSKARADAAAAASKAAAKAEAEIAKRADGGDVVVPPKPQG